MTVQPSEDCRGDDYRDRSDRDEDTKKAPEALGHHQVGSRHMNNAFNSKGSHTSDMTFNGEKKSNNKAMRVQTEVCSVKGDLVEHQRLYYGQSHTIDYDIGDAQH